MSKPKARAPAAKAASTLATSTRDRIIFASIDVFNRQGIQHVAVERIATHLSISPGNLTYHFKRKRDLTHATFDVLQERLRVALKPRLPASSPREGGECLVLNGLPSSTRTRGKRAPTAKPAWSVSARRHV